MYTPLTALPIVRATRATGELGKRETCCPYVYVRIADGLRQLAEQEARRRAKEARRAKDITPARHLITHSKG